MPRLADATTFLRAFAPRRPGIAPLLARYVGTLPGPAKLKILWRGRGLRAAKPSPPSP